jgi:hypothetical protein
LYLAQFRDSKLFVIKNGIQIIVDRPYSNSLLRRNKEQFIKAHLRPVLDFMVSIGQEKIVSFKCFLMNHSTGREET